NIYKKSFVYIYIFYVINIILNRPDFDCHKNSKPVIIYMKIMLATACKKTKPQRVFTLSLAFLNK
ncbi:MAG: hypothetical protein ACFNUG_11785, partial [Tannerella forsythia]|uniref:hypothetical protein n=1 Tax=Tannerella forsythia TaxID=28112 RepID=UPI00360E31C0